MKNYFGNWFFMFNKKANFKNKNVFKRCAALALASAMSLSSVFKFKFSFDNVE